MNPQITKFESRGQMNIFEVYKKKKELIMDLRKLFKLFEHFIINRYYCNNAKNSKNLFTLMYFLINLQVFMH